MRIGLALGDPRLREALAALLRSNGHDVVLGGDLSSCELEITDSAHGANGARATLVLRPQLNLPPDRDPSEALRQALRHGGTAVWEPPFNPRMLTRALTDGDAPIDAVDRTAPDISAAPHPWFVIDGEGGVVLNCNALGAESVDIAADALPVALHEVALPQLLKGALVDRRDGVMAVDHPDPYRYAVWWTGDGGRRIVCLLHDPAGGGQIVDGHIQALADLGRMAATLAHEIRNPVASVAGALDLLEEENDPGEREQIVAAARARLHQMSTLLDDTLRMARPLEGHPESVEMQELIDSALFGFQMDPRFENIETKVDMPKEPIFVRAHPESLRRALTNLMLNAAQAQEDEGGEITIELSRTPHQVVLRVCDRGPGIPKDKWEKIFSPFYTTKTEGTGLGLAYVRRAVLAADGSIEVDSADTGACFRIELPAAPRE